MSSKNIQLGVDVKLQLALADSSLHDKIPPATDNNQADQCGSFTRPRMAKIWLHGGQKVAKTS